MRLALAAHDQVLREAIEAHGGRLFKHAGDGAVAALAIRNNHESGNIGMLHSPLATLAIGLDRLGHHAPAAAITGFAAVNPMVAVALPELAALTTRLRDVLGDDAFESLARAGETMTLATIAPYAYDQSDRARTELNAAAE